MALKSVVRRTKPSANTNVFAGQANQPTEKQLAAALGDCCELWQQLVADLKSEAGIDTAEWNTSSVKLGDGRCVFKRRSATLCISAHVMDGSWLHSPWVTKRSRQREKAIWAPLCRSSSLSPSATLREPQCELRCARKAIFRLLRGWRRLRLKINAGGFTAVPVPLPVPSTWHRPSPLSLRPSQFHRAMGARSLPQATCAWRRCPS